MVIFTSVFRIVDLPSVEFDCIFTGKAEPYLPKPIWKSYFCICREDEARLTLFSEEKVDSLVVICPLQIVLHLYAYFQIFYQFSKSLVVFFRMPIRNQHQNIYKSVGLIESVQSHLVSHLMLLLKFDLIF